MRRFGALSLAHPTTYNEWYGAAFEHRRQLINQWPLAPTHSRVKSQTHTADMQSPCTSVCRVANGKALLASCLDGAARLVDCVDGSLLGAFRGHKHESYGIESCVTADGMHVISASEDGVLRVWEVVRPQLRAAELGGGHAKACVSVQAHPSEGICVSGGHDGTMSVWGGRLKQRYPEEVVGGGPEGLECAE